MRDQPLFGGSGGTRRAALASLGRIAFGAVAIAGLFASPAGARAGSDASEEAPRTTDETLPRPSSWHELLRDGAASDHPVVVLFSTPGCAFCRFVRRDHLRHLAASAQRSGVRVVELSLADHRPFDDGDAVAALGGDVSTSASPPGQPASAAARPESPAALAASLGIRFAPTVAFFGPQGELAERLVGYASADFYGYYLDERIATATAALRQARPRGPAEG